MTVNQIVDMTGVPQANVSQHLMVLRRLGVVKVTKEAQSRIYSLSSEHIAHVSQAMRSLMLEKYGVKVIDQLHRLHVHTDPVCGMEVTAHDASSSLVFGTSRYYFCALGCEKRFQKEPQKYIDSHVSDQRGARV